jgi:hypothetical protein
VCEPCRLILHSEFAAGWARLERYLASWAAFDAWLAAHPAAAGRVR